MLVDSANVSLALASLLCRGFSEHCNEKCLTVALPSFSISYLDSNMHSSCISKQVQGTGLPKPKQARDTHVACWLWCATDRRQQGQTIGRVSRWLFDFPGSPQNSSKGLCLWGEKRCLAMQNIKAQELVNQQVTETQYLFKKTAKAKKNVFTHKPCCLLVKRWLTVKTL